MELVNKPYFEISKYMNTYDIDKAWLLDAPNLWNKVHN